jgi:hypothetical protein
VVGDVAAVAQLPAEQEDFATEILTEELALPPQLMSFMELLQKVRYSLCQSSLSLSFSKLFIHATVLQGWHRSWLKPTR